MANELAPLPDKSFEFAELWAEFMIWSAHQLEIGEHASFELLKASLEYQTRYAEVEAKVREWGITEADLEGADIHAKCMLEDWGYLL